MKTPIITINGKELNKMQTIGVGASIRFAAENFANEFKPEKSTLSAEEIKFGEDMIDEIVCLATFFPDKASKYYD